MENKLLNIHNSINDKFDYHSRHQCTLKYSYAIPNKEAIVTITKYSPIIELGAGTGYWARLLKKNECSIVCYDNKSWGFRAKYFKVKKGSYNVLPRYKRHTLFLCWPPYNSSFAYDCLSRYIGQYFLYIGEANGGCCGCDKFFELLNKWNLIKEISIPQWNGIHDRLFIYSR